MSAHSSWRCCTAGSTRRPRAERPFVRPRRAELLTVRLRRSARALAIVDVCGYDPGCGHGAVSPCLQAVRRSRAGRNLLVLGLRPGSAGPGRLGLEVETAPAKIFRYSLVSSSPGVLVRCDSVAADAAAIACPRMADPVLGFTLPHHRWSPWAPMAERRFRPGWGTRPGHVHSTIRGCTRCPLGTVSHAQFGPAMRSSWSGRLRSLDGVPGNRGSLCRWQTPLRSRSAACVAGPSGTWRTASANPILGSSSACSLRPLSRAMPARSESVPYRARVLEFRVASPHGLCGRSWQCPASECR